jgi:hypothetical protein
MSAQKASVIVRVTSDGTISAETVGIKGPKCLDYIELLEDLLDANTVRSNFTHEFQEHEDATHYEVRNDVQQQ